VTLLAFIMLGLGSFIAWAGILSNQNKTFLIGILAMLGAAALFLA
jgi:hypothetical protein